MYFDSEEIYNKVDKMRLDRGWSIYYLANLAGVSENTLYSWRDRNSSPTLYLIEGLATAFGISPIALLLKEEDIVAIQEEHKELFERWNGLTVEQKESLMSMLRSFQRDVNQ